MPLNWKLGETLGSPPSGDSGYNGLRNSIEEVATVRQTVDGVGYW